VLLLTGTSVWAHQKNHLHIKRLFTVSKINDRYLFEIPDSLLGREMIVVTRLEKAPAGLSVEQHQYGGEQENKQVWKWEKHGQLLARIKNTITDSEK
jgi:hypothetical protein